MLKVYNYMGIGLVVTGLVAYFTYTLSFVEQAGSIVGLTALGDAALQQPAAVGGDAGAAGLRAGAELRHQQAVAGRDAGPVLGLRRGDGPVAVASIFAVYTGGSIAKVFFISAAMFGGMSLYGYTTKRDLTQIGSFLIMGLFGLIIASIVNIIWPSGPLGFAISIVGVVIFLGLTAWDTQKIKESYSEAHGADVLQPRAPSWAR